MKTTSRNDAPINQNNSKLKILVADVKNIKKFFETKAHTAAASPNFLQFYTAINLKIRFLPLLQ